MIGITGVPFDEFSSFMRGPAKAPQFIRQAFHSNSANYFTENRIDLKNNTQWQDAGDMKLPQGKAAIREIEREMDQLLAKYDKVLALGGDHSVSYPLVKATAKKFGKLTILHLDAHGDLYDEFDGNKYSHACPFARIMEEGLASRLVQVGIRTMTQHQYEQVQRFGVEVIEMRDWKPEMEFSFEGPVYISLDLDAVDPAFAPGISHHEPGGFTSREIISLIQKVKGNIVGADLVELNPDRDHGGITAMLAAKLFKELLELLLKK
ncbi:MAG TPA: agmatinase [Cyclobacteriaceae bacterium]|nr:agmatinase [Cyclobacteriaceae bacterium]